MDEFFLHVPTKVVFGLDVLNHVGQAASELGVRALLVTEGILHEQKIVERVRSYLEKSSVETIVFDELGPRSTSSAIERAIEIARSGHVELVIGLGGIRALSAAKCVARMATVAEPLDDYFTLKREARSANPPLPFVAVPTTCRDPFMLTDEALTVDARNRRSQIVKVGKVADYALVDPALTLSLSERYTVSTMLDTLLCAIEAYFSRKSTFLSDTLCLRAVGIITSIMDELAERSDDRNLRFQASQAGLFVALSLTTSTLGVGSAIAYALSGKRSIPKSTISAIMLPHVLDLALKSQPRKVERIGNVLGEEIYGKPLSEFSVHVVDAMRQRMSLLRVPMRLKDFDVGLDEMVEIASIAGSFDMARYLPEPMAAEDIYALIKTAM